MRVLLDEQIDWRLKRLFDSGHRVETVREPYCIRARWYRGV